MTDKPKIPHNVAPDSSLVKLSEGSYTDRSKLAQLYPKPKTYKERELDDKLRQKSYRRQWPRYPSLSIAMYGSIVFGLMVRFIQSLNGWWFSRPGEDGITMSIVFFSFLLGLGLMFIIVVWVGYTDRQFVYFGGLARLFWIVYGILFAILLAVWLSGLIGEYTNILLVPTLAIVHFICLFFSTRQILGQKSLTE